MQFQHCPVTFGEHCITVVQMSIYKVATWVWFYQISAGGISVATERQHTCRERISIAVQSMHSTVYPISQ